MGQLPHVRPDHLLRARVGPLQIVAPVAHLEEEYADGTVIGSYWTKRGVSMDVVRAARLRQRPEERNYGV